MNDIQNTVQSICHELGKQLVAGVNGMSSDQVADTILNPTNKFKRLARMVRTANKLANQISTFKHSID